MAKISPTRINLLSLKKELKTARKGHKLLKDKRDGLVREFMRVIKETRSLRKDMEEKLPSALTSYIRSSSTVAEKIHDVAFMLPNATLSIKTDTRHIMSVPIPTFTITKEGSSFSYGFLETSGELDNALIKLEALLPDILRLAELERAVENLAEEIERTRRRTSALENIHIPRLETNVRYIAQRLDEQARDAVVSTMRIKAMITEPHS